MDVDDAADTPPSASGENGSASEKTNGVHHSPKADEMAVDEPTDSNP
jgi:hypothetical protein